MKVGGSRQLIIPPELAYGPNDYYSIPGNSVLVFTVDAVSAQ
jgi:FKBP-type peptidyl-prolyl cis-trans isomerase